MSFKIGGKRTVQTFLYHVCHNVSYYDPVLRICGACNDFCKDLEIFSQHRYTYFNIVICWMIKHLIVHM